MSQVTGDRPGSIDPTVPVDRQLAAFNAGDIDAFCEQYSDDLRVYALPGGEELVDLSGSNLRPSYAELFAAHPQQVCEVLARLVHDRTVVDHERITGRTGGLPLTALVIYSVGVTRIEKVWLVS